MVCPFRPCLVSFVVAVHYSTLLSTAGGPIRITRVACSMPVDSLSVSVDIQRPKKWLVRGLVKFVTAVDRLVCLNLLG